MFLIFMTNSLGKYWRSYMCVRRKEKNRFVPRIVIVNELTPIMALSSVMVTCLARSTALATCCWCSCERKGSICAIMAFSLFAISVWKIKKEKIRALVPGTVSLLLERYSKREKREVFPVAAILIHVNVNSFGSSSTRTSLSLENRLLYLSNLDLGVK